MRRMCLEMRRIARLEQMFPVLEDQPQLPRQHVKPFLAVVTIKIPMFALGGMDYREEKLMVGRRGGRKRALGTRAPMVLPHALNQRRSLDFVSDTPSDGRRFRILAIVDDSSRECLTMVVDTSLGGVRVVSELERLAAVRGTPQVIVSDNELNKKSMAGDEQTSASLAEQAMPATIAP